MSNQKLLLPIIKIIKKAGQVLLEIQQEAKEIKKERKDFLTEADLRSHSLISERLQELTPEIPIYSEEGEVSIDGTKKAIWVVDPLDGTFNFFHQDVFWGISIAFVENQQTQLGVIYLPALNQLAGATKESDIITEGRGIALKVRTDTDLSRAQIWLDWGKASKAVLSILPKIAAVSLYPQIRLCATASLMAVATGKITAYILPQPAPEDFAAGALIVERAGGRVTDLLGNPWMLLSDSIVASNGVLHNRILKEIKN